MSILSRISAFSGLFGTLFSGNRDLYATFGYRKVVTFMDMYHKYIRQDIAARVVEAEPHAIWSSPPEVESSTQAFVTEWKNLQQRHNLYTRLAQLDKLVGIGRYSILLIGLDDGQPLDKPAREGRKHQLIYLQPYSEATAEILRYEEDPRNPRFGKPTLYRINPNRTEAVNSATISSVSSVKSGMQMLPFEVHHSRVLHVAENTLEDDTFGIPRLLRVYNLLDDIIKTAGGSAETFWLTANRGMQVDVDKEMDLKADDAEALSEEIDEYFHNLRRVIRTKGVKIHNLGSDVADPRGTFNVLIALLAGATGIPQRILLGSEAGQLASEQDRANWATKIEERRSLFAEPVILNPFVRKMVELGVLPEPADLTYKWPDAFKQNPLERAQTSAQQARSLANVSKALSDVVPVVTPEEGRAIIGLKGDIPSFDDRKDVTEGTVPRRRRDPSRSGGDRLGDGTHPDQNAEDRLELGDS